MTASLGHHAADEAGTRPLRRPTLLAAVVLAVAGMFQHPQPFIYDASVYWRGSVALTHAHDIYSTALLQKRGVLSVALYLPAAAISRVTGQSAAGFAVLAENSLLIAVLGAVLIPRIVGLWRPVTPAVVYTTAALTLVTIGRFAPYPLTDVWAAGLVLAAVLAIARLTPRALLVGGLLTGAAVNVRPAYLVVAVLLFGVVAFWARGRTLWFAAGAFFAVLPETILNLAQGTGWAPWPPDTGEAVTSLQAHYGSFAVRYDTITGTAGDPRQFFCSPGMASAAGTQVISTDTKLAELFLSHPVQSIPFAAEKIAGALHWPVSAPYYDPASGSDAAFALLITAIAVVGVISWATSFSRTLPHTLIAVLIVGVVASVITSVPETRFALPLLVVGIAGCASLIGQRPSPRWLIGSAVAVLLVFALGYVGLSHPAPAGDASVAVCRQG